MKIKGWDKVFKFTFLQMVKSKSYIISTIVILIVVVLMALGINFLPGLLGGGESGTGTGGDTDGSFFGINRLYISDQSGLELDFLNYLARVEVVGITPDETTAVTARINQSSEAEILIEITRADHGFALLASRPESTEHVTADNCYSVLGVINGFVWNSHLTSLGVPADRVHEAWGYVSAQVTIAGEEPKNEFVTAIMSSILPMISSLILLIFILTYAQLTGQSIAMEKTSRVMETLLTSVRPMAVILGKTLGMGLASFTQFLILGAGSALIALMVAPFGTIGEVFGMIDVSSGDMEMVKTAFDEVFAGFNLLMLVWIILLFILGFFFYSLIAGLFGASVSRIEDLQSAMLPLNLIGILGFYLAYMSPAFSVGSEGVSVMERISYYMPISSAFALPGAIISGTMGTVETLISIFVLAACGVFMLMFVARIYEAIIMNTGNRIKLGTMLKMAKKK